MNELQAEYSVRQLCEVLSVNRSSLYYHLVEPDPESETELKYANTFGEAKLMIKLQVNFLDMGIVESLSN